MGTILVCAAALFYFALGLRAFIQPKNLLADFGIFATKDVSRNEIRAVYGGFPIAVSSLLLFSLVSPNYADGILLAVSISSLGMALGRLISAVIDRTLGRIPAIFVCIEIVIAGFIAAKLAGI
jgi:hypothetical protein